MRFSMAVLTEDNEISFRVIAAVAAKELVMDFEAAHCTTRLAAPAVSPEYLLPQILIRDRIQA